MSLITSQKIFHYKNDLLFGFKMLDLNFNHKENDPFYMFFSSTIDRSSFNILQNNGYDFIIKNRFSYFKNLFSFLLKNKNDIVSTTVITYDILRFILHNLDGTHFETTNIKIINTPEMQNCLKKFNNCNHKESLRDLIKIDYNLPITDGNE